MCDALEYVLIDGSQSRIECAAEMSTDCFDSEGGACFAFEGCREWQLVVYLEVRLHYYY